MSGISHDIPPNYRQIHESELESYETGEFEACLKSLDEEMSFTTVETAEICSQTKRTSNLPGK